MIYSDDESDEEFGERIPQEQPLPSFVSSVVSGDKSPLKDILKPETVTNFKAEEFSSSIQTTIATVVSKTSDLITSSFTDDKPKLTDLEDDKPIDLKDDRVQANHEDKPKSPLDSVKSSLIVYSDDESDEEYGVPRPQEKPASQPIPSADPYLVAGDKSSLKPEEKPAPVVLKDDKIPAKPEDKPKSPLDSVKSDEEYGVPRPQEKPASQPIPSVVPSVVAGDKSPLKLEEKPAPVALKDDKIPAQRKDKPKSPLDSVKPSRTVYSDDESDEVYGVPRLQEKPLPSAVSSVPAGDKSPLKDIPYTRNGD
ncbi:GL12866 [Drosophila persimilis]|uniref:GL12866 n=1 Tax=Drosophila persimilis TaxID=7234 RepID=B4IS06_DROPE|nr:GL12866 [Drosophila persimilis]